MTPPCRVFAVLNATKETVFLIGNGLYVADEVPPPEIKFAGLPVRRPNPKIILDNGDVVWGCECWFGEIERYDEFVGKRTVMHADIKRARARAKESANNFDPED